MIDLFLPGAYLRCPGGNVEGDDRTREAAKWIACNIGGDPCVNRDPSVWTIVRQRHIASGIQSFPWLHCRNLDDVRFLCEVGQLWQDVAIGLNLEDVQRDFTEKGITLADIDRVVRANWDGPIHIPTLPWIQNGQGWGVFKRAVFALEIMADEQTNTFPGGHPDPVIVDQCIEHAFDEGCEQVTLMLKTKGFTPADYGRQFAVCHSLFTGDDITPTVPGWKLWAQAQPCTRLEEEDPVPPPTQEWWKKPYPKGKAVGPAKLPRPLYPPDAKEKGKTPSPPGPDILAFKRVLKRAQRWAVDVPLANLDDSYGNQFSHGKKGAKFIVATSGVAGFQRQEGIDDTGWLGDATYQLMRTARVPVGPNKGEPLMDQKTVDLLFVAQKMFDVDGNEEKVRKFITEFCLIAEANEEAWHYSQARPVDPTVDPDANSVVSDCSGFVLQAYRYAREESGLPVPDPSKQGYSGFGNTGTNEDDHPIVRTGAYLVGDLAHYNGHVTICRKAGNAATAIWTSNGEEEGPDPRELHYRSDLRFVVRPPLLENV